MRETRVTCDRCGQPRTIGSTVLRVHTAAPRLMLARSELCEVCTSDLAAWLRSPPAAPSPTA